MRWSPNLKYLQDKKRLETEENRKTFLGANNPLLPNKQVREGIKTREKASRLKQMTNPVLR